MDPPHMADQHNKKSLRECFVYLFTVNQNTRRKAIAKKLIICSPISGVIDRERVSYPEMVDAKLL